MQIHSTEYGLNFTWDMSMLSQSLFLFTSLRRAEKAVSFFLGLAAFT